MPVKVQCDNCHMMVDVYTASNGHRFCMFNEFGKPSKCKERFEARETARLRDKPAFPPDQKELPFVPP